MFALFTVMKSGCWCAGASVFLISAWLMPDCTVMAQTGQGPRLAISLLACVLGGSLGIVIRFFADSFHVEVRYVWDFCLL